MSCKTQFLKGKYRSPHALAGGDGSETILLALSGGADSRALLHILWQESRKVGFRLELTHVNHGIRGEEALRDRAFCLELAERYRLTLHYMDADVPTLAAKSGRGLEEEARHVRYDYFEQLMKERNIPILATAHHADDALETVLFHLTRGSGKRGICGIAPSRPFAGGMLVRPLLRLSKKEILRYCDQNQLDFVIDSTNADTAYARNRIREDVIPVLEDLFEEPQARVAALCEDLREEDLFLDSLAERAMLDAVCGEGLSLESLRSLQPVILKRVLRLWLERSVDAHAERTHIEALRDLIAKGRKDFCVMLGNGYSAVAFQDSLLLKKGKLPEATSFCISFEIGTAWLDEGRIRLEIEKINNLSTANTINLNETSVIINDTLYFRSRKEGDTILRGGMHRKLRKLWNEAKIPSVLRDRLPVLCDCEGIVWAPFAGQRDGLETEGERARIRVVIERYPFG